MSEVAKPQHHVPVGARAGRLIEDKIEEGELYDAYQMVASLVNRCMGRGKDVEAVNICHHFGKTFLSNKEFDLAALSGILMVNVFVEFELMPTTERISQLLELFNPSADTKQSKEQFRFIEKALRWVCDESLSPDCELRLHNAAGDGYLINGQFGQAQGHLIYSNNADKLAELLTEWRSHQYPSERELSTLRLVLLLLGRKDVSTAEKLLNNPGKRDPSLVKVFVFVG